MRPQGNPNNSHTLMRRRRGVKVAQAELMVVLFGRVNGPLVQHLLVLSQCTSKIFPEIGQP